VQTKDLSFLLLLGALPERQSLGEEERKNLEYWIRKNFLREQDTL